MSLRRFILRRLLTPAQLQLVDALERPDRWMPDVPITKDEAEAWGKLLASPTLVKIDHAMINWQQQEAQRALLAQGDDLARQAGFALGCKAGWQMAKTLSRLAAADSSQPETDGAPTAAPTLEHAMP